MGTALLGLDASELQSALGAGQPAFRGRQLYEALYRQRVSSWDQVTTLPKSLRDDLITRLPLG